MFLLHSGLDAGRSWFAQKTPPACGAPQYVLTFMEPYALAVRGRCCLSLGVPARLGQFRDSPGLSLGFVGVEWGSWVLYVTLLVAWSYLAVEGYAARPGAANIPGGFRWWFAVVGVVVVVIKAVQIVCRERRGEDAASTYSVRLPDDLVALADERSSMDGVSRGETIRRALIEYLTK